MFTFLVMPRTTQAALPKFKIFSTEHCFHKSPKAANNANQLGLRKLPRNRLPLSFYGQFLTPLPVKGNESNLVKNNTPNVTMQATRHYIIGITRQLK